MSTNVQKSSITKSQVLKGREGVTWDEANFTWDESGSSTWDSVQAIVTGNITKSSVVKSNVNKTV